MKNQKNQRPKPVVEKMLTFKMEAANEKATNLNPEEMLKMCGLQDEEVSNISWLLKIR